MLDADGDGMQDYFNGSGLTARLFRNRTYGTPDALAFDLASESWVPYKAVDPCFSFAVLTSGRGRFVDMTGDGLPEFVSTGMDGAEGTCTCCTQCGDGWPQPTCAWDVFLNNGGTLAEEPI